MRKFVKNELCNIIKQLANVNEALIKSSTSISQEQAQEILTDCQQSAVAVGNKIEECEGDGTESVRLLEEYCEKLYQLCMSWDNRNVREKELKNIRDLLNKVKNSILYEIPNSKKEVVFLPYKASMWDSLESVWMAARDDESCDVYVIPIPYFDKKPDGSLGEMHYEGDMYPDYVPITDWQQYSIEERRPDVIFIHNPYDQYNKVTTVHPRYYSVELRKHTEKLIYIPYFVCWDDVPEHFCTTMAVFYADKVILQSEKVADTYKRIYVQTLGEEQKKIEEQTGMKNREFWTNLQKEAEKKFLPLGSPKFDKVRRTTCKEAEERLPKEWQDKIYYLDPKGIKKRKKVLLYNTSVQALLDYQEQAILKLKAVLRTMYHNSEVVLWWRPHPLNDSTLDAMLPSIKKEYLSIIRKYQQDSWGIYDDTADLNRAIAVSDAYYGDGGSVPALYRETHKPIMFQNYEMISYTEI